MKRILLILLLLFTAYAQAEVMRMKKAVMIIARDSFRDEELLEPKEILERNGIEVKVASTTLDYAKGMLGAKVKPDILVSDVNARDFDAIVFIGGQGASQYWDDPVAQRLAQDGINANRIVAAICIAPVILKGKRATVWSSEATQLKAAGSKYTGQPVEKDGNIITAAGPFAAQGFGEELVKALLGR
jgi:protease I